LVVEAVLVPGLVSSGMSLPTAISAMLIYRAISWLLIAAIGWVVFFFMFRTENEIDPDALGNDIETDNEPDVGPGPTEPSGDAALTRSENRNAAAPVDPADATRQGPLPPDPASTADTSESREHRGAPYN
jgi:hypothetical protein